MASKQPDATQTRNERAAEMPRQVYCWSAPGGRDGVFHSRERSYGTCCRIVPLPQGANGDQAQAKARFRAGVLKITMPAQAMTTGRRLAIDDRSSVPIVDLRA